MRFSRLKRAHDFDVIKWLENSLELTDQQKQKLYDQEIVRFSPYYFYKKAEKKKVGFLWRLTLIAYPIYWILLFCFMPIKAIITGKWGYGRNFIDKFHNKWLQKLDLP